MNPSFLWSGILGSFLPQIPVLIVCAVACAVILSERRKLSRVMAWALAGFGLAMGLAFVIPVGQMLTQQLVMASGGGRGASMGYIYTGLAFFWSLLRAATYLFLLLAVLAARGPNPPPAPPRA